eukprot:GFUD01009649.1.p1 GENE.GFUD01009649.1~~GFUD01009649.1.p1  ORF type:complete len:439 (+),score=121.99 GFUD01009649.1:419-1735(+)
MLELKMAKSNGKEDDETRALEVLLRFLSKKPVHFASVPVALCSLEASRRYKLTGFDIHAVNYIQRNLAPQNVLKVLEKLSSYSSLCACKKEVKPESSSLPSAPVVEEFEKEYLEDKHIAEQNKLNADQEMYDKVIKKCLQILDENATKILRSEEFEVIPLKMMYFILKRDTLCVASELSVLHALDRWSRMQCFLKNQPPSPANKQEMLSGAQYLVRYLLMTPGEIKLGQAQCGLLREKEVFSILKCVSHPNCTCPLNRRLQGIRGQLAAPRTGFHQDDTTEDDLKKDEKITKTWDCEAQEYKAFNLKDDKIEEKDYEHIGDCTKEDPEEDDDNPEETEHIYQSIDGLGAEMETETHGSYHWQNKSSKIREKRCTCVRVSRSRTVYNEAELQKYRAFYQRGGRYSRDRLWSNASTENQIQTQEFNTLEKLFFCLACMFD